MSYNTKLIMHKKAGSPDMIRPFYFVEQTRNCISDQTASDILMQRNLSSIYLYSLG